MAQQFPSVSVVGVKETLKELNKLAPSLRRAYTQEYKKIAQPVIQLAQSKIPDLPPVSGMGRSYKHLGKWDGAKVRKGITVKIDTRRARNRNAAMGATYENVGTFYVISKTGYGMMFDMAGKGPKKDSPFVAALQHNNWGNASRSMWPAWEAKGDEVQTAVVEMVSRVEADTARLIAQI